MLSKKVTRVTYSSSSLDVNFNFFLDLTGPCFIHHLGGLDKLDKISVIEGACCSRTCNCKLSFLEGVEVVCCFSSKNDLLACAYCLISASCGSDCLEVLRVA